MGKYLSHKYEDLRLTHRIHAKILGMVACSCNARAGEVEAGGPQYLLTSQPNLIIKLQANERFCLKIKGGQHLWSNTQSCRVSYTCIHTHMPTCIYIHIHEYTDTHTSTHAGTYTYIYTCTHAYTYI